jgi:hypothetical protein
VQLLDFGTGINFGSSGNFAEFSPTGFSETPDRVSTWTAAHTTEIFFRLPPLRQDMRFVVEVFPFLGDGAVPRQACWVFFNGAFVHFDRITAPVEITFTVSRELFSARANRLSFVLPDAASPSELGISDDRRRLGLAFVKLNAGPAAA